MAMSTVCPPSCSNSHRGGSRPLQPRQLCDPRSLHREPGGGVHGAATPLQMSCTGQEEWGLRWLTVAIEMEAGSPCLAAAGGCGAAADGRRTAAALQKRCSCLLRDAAGAARLTAMAVESPGSLLRGGKGRNQGSLLAAVLSHGCSWEVQLMPPERASSRHPGRGRSSQRAASGPPDPTLKQRCRSPQEREEAWLGWRKAWQRARRESKPGPACPRGNPAPISKGISSRASTG